MTLSEDSVCAEVQREQNNSGEGSPSAAQKPLVEPAPVATDPLPPTDEVVTREVVESIIGNYDPDLEVLDFSAEQGSQVGDNYMSIMYAVNIQIRSKRTGLSGSASIMLKTMPRNSYRQQMLNEMKAFEKEGKMYGQVFKDFETFQKERGIGESEIFQPYPTCYHWFSDGKTDYLAMEDLRPLGFRMGNRVHGLDLAHCEMIIKNLAKFHAISYAMFEGDFERILTTYPFLEERMFKKPEDVDEMYRGYMRQTFSSEADMLRESNPEEAEAVLRVYDEDFYARLRRYSADRVDHAVINHGDCWTNNLLFRYDQESKQPAEFRFIDFQISRVCSRAIDLLYFLYSSPQIEVLNRYEEKLLRIYHDEFTSFGAKLGYVNEQLTWESLVEEFDRCRPFGITLGLMLSPVFSANKDDLPDMENLEFKDVDDNTELANQFLTSSMKSGVAHGKILNIVKNHIPRCDVWK